MGMLYKCHPVNVEVMGDLQFFISALGSGDCQVLDILWQVLYPLSHLMHPSAEVLRY